MYAVPGDSRGRSQTENRQESHGFLSELLPLTKGGAYAVWAAGGVFCKGKETEKPGRNEEMTC